MFKEKIKHNLDQLTFKIDTNDNTTSGQSVL